jgi:hypothetical protein
MPPPKYALQLVTLLLCAGVPFCSGLIAQETCSVEVKLLLSPTETLSARSTLNFKKEVAGFVYFFDTDSLDLLAKGVILRLRRGADSDLTVKLRPPKGRKFFATSGDHEVVKCEEDFTGEGAIVSYSIRRRYTADQLPETGGDISRLLSQGQKKLLREANISIDWSRVKSVVEIKSTTWETRAQAQVRKLTLEAWEWSDGKLLEISTRVKPDDGPPTYAELQELANEKGLSLSSIQRSKTSIVLETLTHAGMKQRTKGTTGWIRVRSWPCVAWAKYPLALFKLTVYVACAPFVCFGVPAFRPGLKISRPEGEDA